METPIRPLNPLVRFVARLPLSLHGKLLTAFLLIVALLFGTSALGLVLMQRAGGHATRISQLTERVIAAARMEYAVTAGMHYRAMHLLTGDAANDEKLVKARQDFAKLQGSLESTADTREASVFKAMQDSNLRFGMAAQHVDVVAHTGRRTAAMKVHLAQEHPISHELEGQARDLIRLASARRDESLRDVTESNRTGLLILGGAAAASVALALLLGYVLSWSILAPVKTLDAHLGRIAHGELSGEISVPNNDELKALAAKANDMSRALGRARDALVSEHEAVASQAAALEAMNRHLDARVHEQVQEIERANKLSSYLAPQVVRAITSGESRYAMGNARKQLTIVFADIRGFTAFSDVAEPEEVISFLNGYLSKMTDLVFKYEGTLDKFLGDGMLVFFNDPVPQPDHAQRAVDMALEMQARAREMTAEWQLASGASFGIGIGISTGFVTVGTIGSETRMEYTVVGTQVNLAARLVTVAEPGEIIVSQRTYELLRDTIDAEQVGPLDVKGFQRPVIAYTVRGRTRHPVRAAA